MRKTTYAFLAAVICTIVIVTGCSNSQGHKPESTTTYEETTSDDVTDNTINTTIDETTSNQEPSSEEATTTKNNDNNSNNSNNNNSSNNSNNNNNNNNSNNSNNNNNSSNNNNSNNHNNNSSSNNTIASSNAGSVVADKNSDKITPTYGSNVSSEAGKLAQAVIDSIITKGMSDFDKAKAIHDYMVVNIDYDYDNYLADTIPNASYNIIGALKNKYAVCAGYAKTFKLLCELAGLECTYVTGTAGGPHAWNQVKIDDKWYNVDVTWDDPVSTDKLFDDHKYNRYSYFLISDEIMYKNHKANGTVHTCPSSLNTKAYAVGAPWLSDTYPIVSDEASLSTVIKQAIDRNSATIAITWDTSWIKIRDMSTTIKGMMLEYVVSDFSMSKYSYITIPNTNMCTATFFINQKNGTYTTTEKLRTIDDIKKLIISLKDGNPDQATVPMANELVNDDIFYQVAVWAFDNHDVSIHISESTIAVNSTTKAVHVYVSKNDYNASYHANEAYRIKNISEIDNVLDKRCTSSESFRVIYRYGDELGRLSSEELQTYVEANLAPAWTKNYCLEYYKISCDDFTCVASITFNSARHSTSGSKWEYEKTPTCIDGGVSIIKCTKCNHITSRHEVEPTGVHDTYWVHENYTKHLGCKHCSYTGPTLYQYGDIWGYYDDNAASKLYTSINKQRENAIYYNIDPFGNLIGLETPPQLTLDSSLSQKLKDTALQAAWLYISNGVGYNFDYNIAIIDGNFTLERASSTLTTASSHLRELFNDKYLTTAGVCCFYYDSDGTGLKMRSIWSIYYGE